jgi:hypothetical protein
MHISRELKEIVEVLQGIVKERDRGSELQLRHWIAPLTGLQPLKKLFVFPPDC